MHNMLHTKTKQKVMMITKSYITLPMWMFHNHQWGRSRNQYHLLPVKDVECIYLACSVPPPCLYAFSISLCPLLFLLFPSTFVPLPCNTNFAHFAWKDWIDFSQIYIFNIWKPWFWKKEKAGYIKTSCEHQSRSVEANTKEINNILMSHDTSQLKKEQYATSNTKHMMAIYRPGHLVPNTCPALYISLSLGSWALPQWQISKAYHCLFAYVLCRLLLSSNRIFG